MLIGPTDSEDHTSPRHDGKQMLTVPCFTTCRDLAEVADHTWKMTCLLFPQCFSVLKGPYQ